MSDFPEAPDMGAEFKRGAGEPLPGKLESVNDTARAEIENNETYSKAHDAHEQLWRDEMRKLAHATNPFPDFDLGSRAHRNIQSEYEERMTDWQRNADQIDNTFEAKRSDIRKTGQTLTDEFAVSRAAPQKSHGDDFAAHDHAHGQDRGR